VGLSSVPLRGIYASGSDALFSFYEGCLREARTYDRAAGYFSSTLYAAAQVALNDFVARGGRLRLICSPHLRTEDFAAMEAGLSLRSAVSDVLEREIRTLLADDAARPGVVFLATLIAEGHLDIRIAYGEIAEPGLFHSKVGVFTDENGSQVAFIGSANETWRAWSALGNHESFAAFATWTNGVDSERVAELAEYFETLWEGRQPGVVVREVPEAPRDFLMSQADARGADAARADLVEALTSAAGRRSAGRPLLPHQLAVLASWHAAGERGVVAHVTGAGKTVTALGAMREWLSEDKPVLVLVPRTLLQTQWRDEVRRELADLKPNVLLAGGEGTRALWYEGLPDQTRNASGLGSRVTIAVADTAASDDFLRRCKAGPHLLVVADEAHNYGSPSGMRLLQALSEVRARLGLSATLERAGDATGTAALRGYFGDDLAPEFGIRDAIAAGRLVPYRYEVATVALEADEEQQYNDLSEQIRRTLGRNRDQELSDFAKMLLIKRARVLKKARGKTSEAAGIVDRHFRDGQHWLLYCDDREQMATLIHELNDRGHRPLEYHSAMGTEQKSTLDTFVALGGVLVAIRCLDEGVDLPVLDHAVILASSTNPREYVQRRGRVLRWQFGKALAYIWDTMVLDSEGVPVSVNEIDRARLFARDAFNLEAPLAVDELYRRGVAAGRFDADVEDEDDADG
jgi:superfamily II DNA or RNA helicase